MILEEQVCSIVYEDPLGIVQEVQPEGSYIWDGTKMPYTNRKLLDEVLQRLHNIPRMQHHSLRLGEDIEEEHIRR